MIGYLYSEDFLKHDPGIMHPEKKDRLVAITEAVKKSDLFKSIVWVKPEMAEKDLIQKNHSAEHVDFVEKKCSQGGGILDLGDTVASPQSFEAASFAVGGTAKMIRMIMNGEFKRGFCAVRPPGHHAEYNTAMGFCLFNNIAVVAKVLIEDFQLERVAIIDWDVHHGNGTQNSFYNTSKVFFISLHQFPHYPGTGSASETGSGEGEGFTLNFPMKPFSGTDDYISAFEEIKKKMDEYKPQFILISAGFDAHEDDPLSAISLKTEDYGTFTEIICEVADKYSEGRVLSLLEGGYNLKVLSRSVLLHLEKML